MRLYYHHFSSPTVRKVRAVALQLELALEEIRVDWSAREHQSPAYLALNPNAKFPTLVDGDFVLWESTAICQYLAAQRPEAGLLPLDERGRADVTRWQTWEIAHFVPATATLIGHNMGSRVLDGDRLQAARDDFDRWAGVLEHHLAGRRWLVRDQLTIADFCVASMLAYAEAAKLPINGLTNLEKWLAAVENEPGWRRSAP